MATLTIDFTPRDTLNQLHRTIKLNTETLHYGLRLIESEADIKERIESEDDFFHIQIGEPLSESDLKAHLKAMLLTKYFEDLIKGLSLALYDSHALLNFRVYLCESPPLDATLINEKHEALRKKSIKTHFPNLITQISHVIGKDLPLDKEMLSINKARNCLVHDNGIVVDPKNINDAVNNTLTVHWLRHSMYKKEGDKEVEMVAGDSISHESPAYCRKVLSSKSFHPGEIVNFNYKEALDVAYTCLEFGQALFNCQCEFLKENTVEIATKGAG